MHSRDRENVPPFSILLNPRVPQRQSLPWGCWDLTTSLKQHTTSQRPSLRPETCVERSLELAAPHPSCSSLYLPLTPAQRLQGLTLSHTATQGSARETATLASEDSDQSISRVPHEVPGRWSPCCPQQGHVRNLSLYHLCLPPHGPLVPTPCYHPVLLLLHLQVPSVCVKRYWSHLWQGYGFALIHQQ